MTKYYKKILMLLLTLVFTLVGCGENDELTTYEIEMGVFSETINNLDNNINAIDSNSEDAVTTLLEYLDDMDTAFLSLAEMVVPDEFIGIESLADEASEYMTASVSAYHDVLTSTEIDEYSNTLASESYDRAMTRIHYISDILQGNAPEGDNISEIQTDDDENVLPEATETTEATEAE